MRSNSLVAMDNGGEATGLDIVVRHGLAPKEGSELVSKITEAILQSLSEEERFTQLLGVKR